MIGSARLWAAACLAALAATAGLAIVLKSRLKATAAIARAPQTAGRLPGDAARACVVPQAIPVRALADADDPPVILWAAGAVRLFVDGAPAFSAPDAPRHFKVGEHTLRAEAHDQEPIQTRFRLDAFTPALFHVQLDEGLGLTLARLGTICASCSPPLDLVTLGFEESSVRANALLGSAASALRRDEWAGAATFLSGVPRADRGTAVFHRLAAGIYLDGVEPDKARAELGLAAERGGDLRQLLAQFDGLGAKEKTRRKEVVRARWNKVTERFQALIGRFNAEAPAPAALASRRLADLSGAFEKAEDQGASLEQEELLAAAEKTLLDAVADIRSARPADCDFQAAVVARVMQ
jgi:hypothetical protein